MKCSTCGTELRMDRVKRPIYKTVTRLGMGDLLRYQADSNETDPHEEVEATCEIMREAAELFDQIQKHIEEDPADAACWFNANVRSFEEQIQVGTEEVEEASDCPRCHGSY